MTDEEFEKFKADVEAVVANCGIEVLIYFALSPTSGGTAAHSGVFSREALSDRQIDVAISLAMKHLPTITAPPTPRGDLQ